MTMVGWVRAELEVVSVSMLDKSSWVGLILVNVGTPPQCEVNIMMTPNHTDQSIKFISSSRCAKNEQIVLTTIIRNMEVMII